MAIQDDPDGWERPPSHGPRLKTCSTLSVATATARSASSPRQIDLAQHDDQHHAGGHHRDGGRLDQQDPEITRSQEGAAEQAAAGRRMPLMMSKDPDQPSRRSCRSCGYRFRARGASANGFSLPSRTSGSALDAHIPPWPPIPWPAPIPAMPPGQPGFRRRQRPFWRTITAARHPFCGAAPLIRTDQCLLASSRRQ